MWMETSVRSGAPGRVLPSFGIVRDHARIRLFCGSVVEASLLSSAFSKCKNLVFSECLGNTMFACLSLYA